MTAPSVTVRDVLALATLAGARLVGGQAGADRTVSGVTVMADPETIRSARPGYLLLASSYTLAPDAAGLAALVPRLAEASLAGLALKPSGTLDDIPDAMRNAADGCGFPIIEVPRETPLNDIAATVLAVVLDHQANRLQRTAEIHERFTEVILSGGATRDVALTLHRLLGRPVAVLDPTRAVVAAAPAEEATAEDAGGGDTVGSLEHPIHVGDEHLGTLVVELGPEDLDDEGMVAVERAAVAIALRQVQARALAEAHESFAAVSLEELVSGQVADHDVLAERAATLGWDLDRPRAVLLAAPEISKAGAAGEAELRVLAGAARTALGPEAIVWVRSRAVGALLAPASPDPAERRRLAVALQREATARLGNVPVGVGVGQPVVDPLELSASLHQASVALEVGRWQHGSGTVKVFEDLGMERLLAWCPASDVDSFVADTLGPLLAYDQTQEGDLTATLAAWIETRSVAETARQVFAHYNTVRKRLDRIEDVLGPVLTDPHRLLDLAVALRLNERSQSA